MKLMLQIGLIVTGLGHGVMWALWWAEYPWYLVIPNLAAGLITATASLLASRPLMVVALLLHLAGTPTLMVHHAILCYQANLEFGALGVMLGLIVGLLVAVPNLVNLLLLAICQYRVRYRNWYTDT